MAFSVWQRKRARRIARGVAILALAMFLAPPATAEDTDVVVFDTGERVVGEVKNFVQGKLKFDTDQADNIYIDWDYVYFLTSSAFFEVYDENGVVYYGTLGTTDEKRQLVVADENGSVVLDMDRVVEFTQIEKSFIERLDGHVDLGLSYTSADSSLQYSLDAAAAYRQKKYAASVELTSIQTRRDNTEDILRDNLRFEYTRYHKKRYFGTGALVFSRNTELGIDFRTELGYAFGRYALVSNRQLLSGRVGFSLTFEDETGAESGTTEAWGLVGVKYHYFLYHYPETNIVVDISVQPSITDWARTRVNLDVSLRREVIEDFTLSLSVYDNYDSEPNEAARAKHDLAVVFSIGWTF